MRRRLIDVSMAKANGLGQLESSPTDESPRFLVARVEVVADEKPNCAVQFELRRSLCGTLIVARRDKDAHEMPLLGESSKIIFARFHRGLIRQFHSSSIQDYGIYELITIQQLRNELFFAALDKE